MTKRWDEEKYASQDDFLYRVSGFAGENSLWIKDKTQIKYNDFLTLIGIPPETFEYKLGNRSALDWIIDQYQVSTDKRSGITNDPNRLDDEESGLVIFAKSSLYKEYLLKNWNTFGVVYNILCLGVIFQQQGTIKTYMLESGSKIS